MTEVRQDPIWRLFSLSFAAILAILVAAPTLEARETYNFSDDFEVSRLNDLLKEDKSRWTHYQNTFPQNKAEIVPEAAPSGGSALRFFAVPSTKKVSKSDIEKEGFELRPGQEVRVAALFFLPPNADLKDLFLIDIECRECWPQDSIYPNQSPGVRLKLRDRDGTPSVERRKIGHPDMRNDLRDSVGLPRGRWFKLEWRLTLSDDEKGSSEILIDDNRVFFGRGPTLPSSQAFEKWGIRLREIMYDRFQIGITANSTPGPIEMLIDDVSFQLE
ncbi:hypothetical protein FHR70_004792 [Microvirga lupini]|uniref:Polysaccharide lyase n=1 Tax=Microvirga lupini TaxID=420324 RepID=A0A7W4VR10_9HYPH|nr:hypothetical protein [Microvirga lupini]MBB3021687.1 hypothetical protein [Microvirga lupini]